jgi:hypothetical protein
MYINAAKSFFNIVTQAACGRDRTTSRTLKDFAAKVYTIFFVQPKICNDYKTNKQNLLHCQ